MTAVEPTRVGFPFARCIVVVDAYRHRKKTGAQSRETRYYLSSLDPDERSLPQWIALVRGHWAGVENRLHWRKDALLDEDKTRSRNPTLVGALMLLRNAVLPLLLDFADDRNLSAAVEAVRAHRLLAFRLLHQRS